VRTVINVDGFEIRREYGSKYLSALDRRSLTNP
jgi:hypothetical protein